MKNGLMISTLILMVTTIFFGYHYFQTNTTIARTADCQACTDYSAVGFGGLNAGTARDLSDNYKNQQLASINSAGYVTNDATSVWFPIDTIKNFLSQIENRVCVSGCTDKAFGVRIYFASYPGLNSGSGQFDDPNLTVVPAVYNKHHTLFMVPTYTDGTSGGPVDFDPWHMNGCTPVPFTRLMDSSMVMERSLILIAGNFQDPLNTGSSGNAGGGTGTNTVQNHGGLCPPICNPSSGISF